MSTRIVHGDSIIIEGMVATTAGQWATEKVSFIPARVRLEYVRAYSVGGQGTFDFRLAEVENPDLNQVCVEYTGVPADTSYLCSVENLDFLLVSRAPGATARNTADLYISMKTSVSGHVKYRITLREIQ